MKTYLDKINIFFNLQNNDTFNNFQKSIGLY